MKIKQTFSFKPDEEIESDNTIINELSDNIDIQIDDLEVFTKGETNDFETN